MTPKEKSDSIIKKFWMKNKNGQDSYITAIDNAKIAVDEILNAVTTIADKKYDFWNEVKYELEKLK